LTLPPIIVAPHSRELGSDAAALFAAEVLGGDCVLASGSGAPEGEQTPTTLAVEMALMASRPLLVIRGMDEPDVLMGGDTLLFANPAPALARTSLIGDAVPASSDEWPRWLSPLALATAGWLTPARPTLADAAALRRFPVGAGRLNDSAILWLSRPARRALAGDSELAHDDFLALALLRGIAVVRVDIVDWLLAGRGAPPTEAIEGAERLARTGDAAMLMRSPAGAAASTGSAAALVVDVGRGLLGIGVVAADRRAVIIAGDRREGRVTVTSRLDAVRALAQGTRTLVGS
jgi:hypothetical protein